MSFWGVPWSLFVGLFAVFPTALGVSLLLPTEHGSELRRTVATVARQGAGATLLLTYAPFVALWATLFGRHRTSSDGDVLAAYVLLTVLLPFALLASVLVYRAIMRRAIQLSDNSPADAPNVLRAKLLPTASALAISVPLLVWVPLVLFGLLLGLLIGGRY